MKKIGIYVHIPFCKRKCFYCDFCSYANKTFLQERYVQALTKEITHRSKENNDYKVDTIYIGGGTPSLIDSKFIKEILNAIKINYKVCDNAEITIEINPGTVDEKKIKSYKEAGINRASIGLQSCDDKILKEIGRIHTYQDFENVYKMVNEVGINNINVDLMIGLPTQTTEDIENTLDRIIEKNPNHISVYSLIIEPGTIMEKLIRENKLILPDDEMERKMYWLVKEKLEKNGYKQYEISNFAKEGFESKHNSNCWNQQEYLGFGIAAHSYIDNIRFSNISNLEKYIENIEENKFDNNSIIQEKQDSNSKMDEYMILGLRKIDGIDYNDFYLKFKMHCQEVYKNEIDKLAKDGLIIENKNGIKLSEKGLDFANVVWSEFV